jgi:hypothetical protein
MDVHVASLVVVRLVDGAKPSRRKRLSRQVFLARVRAELPL